MRLINRVRLGNTLAQLSRGFQSGKGIGTGFGRMGGGRAGESGMAAPFDLFGDEQTAGKSQQSSRLGRRDHPAEIRAGELGGLAGSIEERAQPKSVPLELRGSGGDRFLEEYRRLIEEYFKRMAEETP